MKALEPFALQYDWVKDIEPYLDTIQAVEGGYTSVKRGVVTLADGAKVFVKIASADETEKWLKKEVKAYKILNQAGYPYIPKLLSSSTDNSAMAIEYMDGASFESTWDKEKLAAIIEAQKELRKYKDYFIDNPDFTLDSVVDRQIKWSTILKNDNVAIINEKLKKLGAGFGVTRSQITDFQDIDKDWSMNSDALVHQDIRADNFGYYPDKKTGKLIDWNWLCIGDESLDRTPLFVNMYMSGFDPYQIYPDTYDKKMLAYMVSFWLDQILFGDEDSSAIEFSRRKAQAKSVQACIELISRGK